MWIFFEESVTKFNIRHVWLLILTPRIYKSTLIHALNKVFVCVYVCVCVCVFVDACVFSSTELLNFEDNLCELRASFVPFNSVFCSFISA